MGGLSKYRDVKMGTIFKYKNTTLIVEKEYIPHCVGCFFNAATERRTWSCENWHPTLTCVASQRKDRQHVIFRKVEPFNNKTQ